MPRLKNLLRSLFLPGSIQAKERSKWCGVDRFPGGFFNDRFMLHDVEGDFVRNPEYLWSPGPYWAARAGLDAHFRRLADQLGGSVYSDALLVLHPEDYSRTRGALLKSWDAAVENELSDCWARLVEAQGWSLAMPGRRFHLRVLPDGDSRLGGSLGLSPGQFATALMPNLHFGADDAAVPLAEVFAADSRGRFQSVGTLWSDQLAFTIGAHALDNGRIEDLGDSAIYSVHRIPGEPGLHHRVGAGREDRIVLRSGHALGGDTIRVVDGTRDKLLVEVMLVAAKHLAAEVRDGKMPAARRADAPRVALPAFMPAGLSVAGGTILPEDLDLGEIGAFSIVPESLPDRLFRLVERGFLLQRVQFRAVMCGYTVEIDRDGRIAPKVAAPVAVIQVLDDRVSVKAMERDLAVDGQPLAPGGERALDDLTHELSWRGGSVTWSSMRRSRDRKWPYLGSFTAPPRTTPLAEGDRYTIGRDSRQCDVPLPDRPVADNILWRDGETSGEVQVHGGAVDRRSFRTDAICVATRAAAIDLAEDEPSLTNLSPSCPIHVLRADGETVRLRKDASTKLGPSDELCIGNQLFSLIAPGASEVPLRSLGAPAPAPASTVPRPGETNTRRRASQLAETARRPSAGGRPAPIAAHRTYGQLLGAGVVEEASPIAQIGPSPTDMLPSIDLDPTTLGDRPTILDDSPVAIPVVATPVVASSGSWVQAQLAEGTPTVMGSAPPDSLATGVRAAFAGVSADVESVPELEPVSKPAPVAAALPARPVLPRGLRIDTVHEPEGGYGTPRRRPRRAGLPRFSPVARNMARSTPSHQGD